MNEQPHNKTVYDLIQRGCHEMHPTLIYALLQTLDPHDLALAALNTDWPDVEEQARRVREYRRRTDLAAESAHRLNYPIAEVLDDYVNRRKGRLVEAKRQLRKRFDGLDHDMQKAVMMAFMERGCESERRFICDKLYGDGFWTDEFIPLVEKWWEQYRDGRMAKVVIKRCPPAYLLAHLEELKDYGSYATLCLRTGISPDPEKMLPRTYLYVLKSTGGQLRLRGGEEAVLKCVRQYLYEESVDRPVDSIYDIPYVRRMLAYLGEMGQIEDILAIEALERRMASVPKEEWATAVIRAIEQEFSFPPFLFTVVK